VWNVNTGREADPAYFLGFTSGGAKRIAYAASLGSEVPPRLYPVFQRYIPAFDHVSVREKSSQAFIQRYTDKPVSAVLDPTLLIAPEDWENIAVFPAAGKYILAYDLWSGPVMAGVVNAVSRKLGLKVISYCDTKPYEHGYSSFYHAGPAEFLGLLLNAEFVVTSSFHGAALAIARRKNFLAVPHPTRGARMTDLLDTLGLTGRLVRGAGEAERMDLTDDMAYAEADALLQAEREKSLGFLRTALR
jgi:hypothetical protein